MKELVLILAAAALVVSAAPQVVAAQTPQRAAGGITRFRAKYGLGPNHDHAMRHCVRLYTGW